MRILFFMRHAGYVRNFERVLQLLIERGHEVELSFDTAAPRWLASQDPLGELSNGGEPVRTFVSPQRLAGNRGALAETLRHSIDYMRYLAPPYANAPKLRRRAERHAPRVLQRFGRSVLARRDNVRGALTGALSAVERSLGISADVGRFLDANRPDVVLITPFVGLGSDQVEYLRAAHHRSIPVGVCVASWDNLTNKGVIRESPDLVAVWNEPQREEAISLHGIAPERVVATGAHSYDHWFEWSPGSDSTEFRRRVGLDPEQPFLLYVCSSRFVAREEVSFVLDWLSSLRSAGGPLAEIGVLIRPHPQNAAQWREAPLEGFGNVRVWPKRGEVPVSPAAREEYFDSIYHCRAVVGLNTSALIESAIVGRPVLTVLDERYRETQTGTLHFAHLTSGEEPLLVAAESFDEHLAQLEVLLAHEVAASVHTRFLETFIRPYGLDRPGAPRLVEAIERLPTLEPLDSGEPSTVEGLVSHAAVETFAAARASARIEHRVARSARSLYRRLRRRARRVVVALLRRAATAVLGPPVQFLRDPDKR